MAQWVEMCKAWQFGGRPIVHDVGRLNSRHFAWSPREGEELALELREFTEDVRQALHIDTNMTTKVTTPGLENIDEDDDSDSDESDSEDERASEDPHEGA